MKYSSRETKAKYIFEKYGDILSGRVLDVGADAMYLKPMVQDGGSEYIGIGFGDEIDVSYNLEQTPYPFEERSFDTVVCFDVLEHLEQLHSAFDELCRIAKSHVVISLPNPASDLFSVIRGRDYSETRSLKFYGLPIDPPEDRHRWFFTEKEAAYFVKERADRNGFKLVQMDALGDDRPLGGAGLKGGLIRSIMKIVFRKDIEDLGLNHGTLWFVLSKREKS